MQLLLIVQGLQLRLCHLWVCLLAKNLLILALKLGHDVALWLKLSLTLALYKFWWSRLVLLLWTDLQSLLQESKLVQNCRRPNRLHRLWLFSLLLVVLVEPVHTSLELAFLVSWGAKSSGERNRTLWVVQCVWQVRLLKQSALIH